MAETASIIVGTMATAIKGSSRSSGGRNNSAGFGGGGNGTSSDRVLGAAASLGLCLAILRVVGTAYTASRHLEHGGESSDNVPASSSSSNGPSSNKKSSASGSVSVFLLSYVRNFLKRMLLEDNDVDVFDDDNVNSNLNSSASITYSGSCHCGAVGFEVVAPRSLQARDGVGKIQYRHTKVKTSDFRAFRGQRKLKTYYVQSDSCSQNDRGAHAFCQDCGVHILYAPWKNSPHIFVNMNCLSEGVRKVQTGVSSLVGGGMMDPILDSVPAADFDNQSTVSEVSGDSRWNLFLHHDSNTSSVTGTAYDDVSISDYSYARKPHQISISPSTTAQTELSSNASSSVMRMMDGDDSTVRSYKSSRSSTTRTRTTTGSISLQPLQIQKVSPAEQNLSPAMRDQMKKYMKRHLSATAAGGNDSTTKNSEEIKTIQTMKKQTVHAVTRAVVGNDPSKYA